MLYDLLYPVCWVSPPEFVQLQESRSVAPALRMLLGSNGSTTTAIEMLTAAPVAVEVLRQEERKLPPLWSDFLDLEPLQPALGRDVWLAAGGRRVVFAASCIPLRGLDPELRRALETRTRPLGATLEHESLPIIKDRIAIGRARLTADPDGLGLPVGATLWMRRYRLTAADRLTAGILEIFDPEIFDPAPRAAEAP